MNKKIDELMHPYEYTVSLISGRWKMKLLFFIACSKVARYGEIKRNIEGITHKMLSSQLKELERDGLVLRKEYSQIPPKVEYSLTQTGNSLIPTLNQLCSWGKQRCTAKPIKSTQ